MENKPILVLILAGGQSRRMGRDKAALPFGGETMLTRLVGEYGKAYPVAVSVAQPGKYDTSGAPEIVDHYPGQGPLAGLQAAFRETDAEYIFLTGTDLPFGTVELAQTLLIKAQNEEGQAWVVRRKDGKMEPLCGVYHCSCLSALEDCLNQGRRSFKGLFQCITVCYVEEDALTGFDLEHLLDNLNTPEDYQRAVKNQTE
jgi:molybdopterin-guanine dinucleotide biosynthesis protein A